MIGIVRPSFTLITQTSLPAPPRLALKAIHSPSGEKTGVVFRRRVLSVSAAGAFRAVPVSGATSTLHRLLLMLRAAIAMRFPSPLMEMWRALGRPGVAISSPSPRGRPVSTDKGTRTMKGAPVA